MRLFTLLGAGLLGLAAACSPQSGAGAAPAGAASAAAHPVSGLPVIALSVAATGKVHRFRVEVAKGGFEQAKGLMFRTSLGAEDFNLWKWYRDVGLRLGADLATEDYWKLGRYPVRQIDLNQLAVTRGIE